MTDTPHPSAPAGDPGDEQPASPHPTPESGATYPGPPPGPVWSPAPPRSGVRALGTRIRGSRIAQVAIGVVVAAALVLGGFAVAHDGHENSAGKDGRRAASRAGSGDERGSGNSRRAGHDRAADARDGTAGTGTQQQVIGTITAVSSTSITVQTSGGIPTYPVTTTTPVTRGGAAAGVVNLKVGDAVVIRVVVSSTGAAPVVESITAG